MEYIEVLVNELSSAVLSVNGHSLGHTNNRGCLAGLFGGGGGPDYPGKSQYFSFLNYQGWQLISSIPTRGDYFDATPYGKYMFGCTSQFGGHGEIEWKEENGKLVWREKIISMTEENL